jgi:hypothetical protein
MLEHSKLRFIAIAAVVLLLMGPIALGSAGDHAKSNAQTQSTSLGLIIPLYSYPGWQWSTIVQEKYAHPNVPIIAIISPDTGPGYYVDSNFVSGIRELQAAGISVVGYVNTQYASYSLSSLEYQVSLYNSWYHVNGIFFDCMSNAAWEASYYWSLNSYSRSLGMTLNIGNPGASVPSNDIGVFNILNVYENSGAPYLSNLWYGGYPASDFSLMAYGVPWFDPGYLSAATNEVGYIYLTDGVFPNPYATLPSYFSTLVSDLASIDYGSNGSVNGGSVGAATITVQSIEGGSSFSGMWTLIQSNGRTVASGFTPLTFTGSIGQQYTVSVGNYESYIFSRWGSGSTNPSDTFTLSQNTQLSAYYGDTGSSTITVESAIVGGSTFSGMWTVIQTGGVTIATGFTPLTVSVNPGVEYSVSVGNYQSYNFNHWTAGSTSSTMWVSGSQSSVLTAYYT